MAKEDVPIWYFFLISAQVVERGLPDIRLLHLFLQNFLYLWFQKREFFLDDLLHNLVINDKVTMNEQNPCQQQISRSFQLHPRYLLWIACNFSSYINNLFQNLGFQLFPYDEGAKYPYFLDFVFFIQFLFMIGKYLLDFFKFHRFTKWWNRYFKIVLPW